MFNRRLPNRYTIIARVRGGDFFRRFSVAGYAPYEACRRFDNNEVDWIRVSGATVK